MRHQPMFRRLILAISIPLTVATLPLGAPAAHAQLASPSGVRVRAPSAPKPTAHARSHQSRLPHRFGLAVVGSVTGLFAGALISSSLSSNEECPCFYPLRHEAYAGSVIGTALGAALLAALPQATRACEYPRASVAQHVRCGARHRHGLGRPRGSLAGCGDSDRWYRRGCTGRRELRVAAA
jgi:hypothetical protein